MLEKVFSSRAHDFAAVLTVKGALRRARKRRALDRCGPLQGAPLWRKSKNKKTSQSFLRRQSLLPVLRLGFVFHQKMLR
jgi:hypothetical protein